MKKRDRRFNQKITTLGDPITVSVSKTENPERREHGYFLDGNIVIGEHVPEPLKHTVFMHEVLHMVDQQLVGMGVTKRQIPHDWIINASPLLVAFLVESGFWKNGPTMKELDTAMRSEWRKDQRRQRKGARPRTPQATTKGGG